MRFCTGLYVSDKWKKKKEKIIGKLLRNKPQYNLYLVVLSRNKQDSLEILHSALFLQPCYPREDVLVTGICKGYEEALACVEEIAKEVYRVTKGADIRGYILKREQEE